MMKPRNPLLNLTIFFSYIRRRIGNMYKQIYVIAETVIVYVITELLQI